MNKVINKIFISGSLLIIGTALGVWMSRQITRENQSSLSPLPSLETAIQPLPQSTSFPINKPSGGEKNINFISQAAEKVGPAVVRIEASQPISPNKNSNNNPLFRNFLPHEIPPHSIERGTGSGFIISSDGLIITNAHVVHYNSIVSVLLQDGSTYEGKILGVDTITDVAVIKIAAQNLPTVILGSAEELVPGEWAIAIGNPLGLNNTVTAGIISGINRSSTEIGITDKRVRFIQTDAAINPGNSGGPLLNAHGEVIGVNTAIRGNAQGLGFAIPIDTASRIAKQLYTTGKASHPYLGIQMTTINQDTLPNSQIADNLGLNIKAKKGVLIIGVVENSPASQAGFQRGDIILKVAQKPVFSPQDVQEQVELSNIGEILVVEIERNGQPLTLKTFPIDFPVK